MNAVSIERYRIVKVRPRSHQLFKIIAALSKETLVQTMERLAKIEAERLGIPLNGDHT